MAYPANLLITASHRPPPDWWLLFGALHLLHVWMYVCDVATAAAATNEHLFLLAEARAAFHVSRVCAARHPRHRVVVCFCFLLVLRRRRGRLLDGKMAAKVEAWVKLRTEGMFGANYKKMLGVVEAAMKMLTLYEDEKKRSVNNPKLEIMYKDIKATVVDAKKEDTWDVFASDGKIYTISGCPSIVDAIKQSLVVEVARVMPPPEQVNQLFKMVMDILAIPDKQRGYMMEKTTVENQWKMIQLHNVSLVDDSKVEEAAKKWADMLRKGRVLSLSEASELERDVRTANKLWLMSFFNHDGLGGLFEQLAKLALRSSRTEEENKIAKHVVESVKATMNVSFGVERLLDTPNSVENLVNVLDVDLLANREFSEIVLELLSVLCFFEREDKDGADPDQGHKDVIAGFRQFAVQRGEIAPFHSLVSAMQRCKYHIDFPLVVIRLINEMINRTDRIEDRIPLRQEFERVSLLKVLLECHTHYDKNEGIAEPRKVEAFKRQIQQFESIMVADNEDWFISSATDVSFGGGGGANGKGNCGGGSTSDSAFVNKAGEASKAEEAAAAQAAAELNRAKARIVEIKAGEDFFVDDALLAELKLLHVRVKELEVALADSAALRK